MHVKNIDGGRLTQGVTCPRLYKLLEMPLLTAGTPQIVAKGSPRIQ